MSYNLPQATSTNPGLITLTGDLSGTATNPTVASLQGITISGTPTDGYVLTATSSSAADWQAISSGSVTLSGDVTGAASSNTVTSITGTSGVVNVAATGNIITWAAATTAPGLAQTAPSSDLATANMTIAPQAPYASAATNVTSGSLTVALTNPISGLNQPYFNITENGTQKMQYFHDPTGGTEGFWGWNFGTSNLSNPSGINAVGVFSDGPNVYLGAAVALLTRIAGNTQGLIVAGDANVQLAAQALTTTFGSSSKGVIGITNAVALPTSNPAGAGGIAVYSNAGALETYASGFQFHSAQATPKLTQNTTSSASGTSLTVQAQGATGASNNGGNLILASGTSGSATVGTLELNVGSTTVGSFSQSSNDFLSFGAQPSATGVVRLPNNTFIYQRNAANSADIAVIGNSGGNGLIIGDATNNTGAMTIQCASNINIQPKNSCTIAQQTGGNLFAIAFDSMLLELPLVEFQFNQAAPVITQVTQNSDAATNTITIKAQQAYASATTHITGGQLSLSSGVGVASGTATASEAAGILSLQAGTTQVMGLDGYGVFLEQPSGGAVSVTSNVTLSAAQVICPYIVLTGTVGAGGVTLSIPGAVAANTARMWHFDLTAVTLTGTLTFSIGTGSTTASISSLTTNSQIVTLFAPTSNTCFLNL